MLHDASGPTWSQTCFLPGPGTDTAQADLAVQVLGRFLSRGGFDHQQVPGHVSLHLVTAGDGVLLAQGQRWQIGPGGIFTFVPGVPVRYLDAKDRPWRYTWCVLTGRQAEAIAEQLGGSRGVWARAYLPCRAALGVLDAMEAAFRSEDHSPYYAQAAAWQLVDALSPRRHVVDRTGHLAVAIRRILEEQYAAPLKLGTLARQLGVDRSTVFRRFQALYGCSPKVYLDRWRLAHGQALVRDGGLSIAAIASRCGYASAQRFSKAFAARYGMAPSRLLGHSGPPRARRTTPPDPAPGV